MLLIVLTINRLLRNKRYKTSWYYSLYKLLDKLESELDTKSNQDAIAELSKLLRIIAIKQFSRSKCSTLMGYEWLEWLTEHDPNNFPWLARGKILIPNPNLNTTDTLVTNDHELTELIAAAKRWVNAR